MPRESSVQVQGRYWKSSRPLKVVEEERKEEDLATGLESMSSKDKCYVLLSNLIKDLASQTTKQFLGVAK